VISFTAGRNEITPIFGARGTLWYKIRQGGTDGIRDRYYDFFNTLAQAAWRNGHRIRLRNEKTRVQIPPGFKVFRET
jgi:hypothetical protein